MDNSKPMKIVLIEDSAKECKEFMVYAKTRTDIDLVGITGSSDEGLRIVKYKIPEAVIVDLELTYGSGSGYEFLDKFFNTEFSIRPIVVITTKNRNNNIHALIHEKYGIETLFYKKQKGYGPKMVIDHLTLFRQFYSSRESGMDNYLNSPETPEELEQRIMGRIKAELNLICMPIRYKGRRMAEEAIYMLLQKKPRDSERVFNDIAKKHKIPYVNVTRNIQNAINKVWNNPDNVEELVQYYSAPVSKSTGCPTATELIHYYADKIRPDL